MGEVLKKVKVPIIILVVLVIGFFAYNTFFKKEGEAEGDVKTAQKKAPNQEFLPLFNLIKNVNFDDTLFNDAVFRSLIDFSKPVREEQRGRDNPFSPGIVNSGSNFAGAGIVFDASENSTSTATSTTTGVQATATTTASTTPAR